MSSYKTRPIDRDLPICWQNSGSQLLNTIDWPKYFYDYIVNERDIVSSTFNMILTLRSKSNQRISANFCNQTA